MRFPNSRSQGINVCGSRKISVRSFEAELVGMLLGLQLIKNGRRRNVAYAIWVDNQAAIKSLASKLDKPGHYLAAEVLDAVAKLRRTMGKKFSLTIRWTAGHRNTR